MISPTISESTFLLHNCQSGTTENKLSLVLDCKTYRIKNNIFGPISNKKDINDITMSIKHIPYLKNYLIS